MSKRLGRGLADLIETAPVATVADVHAPAGTGASSAFVMLGTEQISPGRYQPRTVMTREAMEELKASIQRQGVIEPVLVRPIAHGSFELVAGERRWRACKALGIKEVPAIIRPLADREALEFSLIENIQRENLNPIEEAHGYSRLLEEFGYTQEQVAEAVGKDRATVANLLRLLKLPDEVQAGLAGGDISLGHAKVLVGIEARLRQLELYHRSVKERLSVRQLEVLSALGPQTKRKRRVLADPQMGEVEARLRQSLGTKVTVSPRGTKGGRIAIDYFSQEDLMRLLPLLGVPS